MAFCNACGKEIDASAVKYCPYCGAEVQHFQPAEAQAPPPSPEEHNAPSSVYRSAPPPGVTLPPPRTQAHPSVETAGGGSSGRMIAGVLGLSAMALAIIGSFLPWVTAFGISENGMNGDGPITLILASVTIVFLIVGFATKKGWPFAVSLALAMITSAVFIIDMADIISSNFASVGAGIYVGLAGAFLGVVFSIAGLAIRS